LEKSQAKTLRTSRDREPGNDVLWRGAMSISHLCLSSLKDLAVLVWEIANSDQIRALIWLALGTIWLVRWLLKMRISEARDLAAALTAGLIWAIVIAATSSPATSITTATLRKCTAPERKVASIKHPDVSKPSQGNE
jgi:hypothetical protein